MSGSLSVAASGTQNVDGLLSGVKWDKTVVATLTYSFPGLAGAYADTTDYLEATDPSFAQISAQQQVAARDILGGAIGYTPLFAYGSFASVIDYAFSNVASPGSGADAAVMRLAVTNGNGNTTAFAYYPGDIEASPAGDPRGGDSWYSTSYDYGAPTPGDYAWLTHMHEFGHAMGLKHGHEVDGPANTAMMADRDSMEFAVMTYRSFVGADTGGGYVNEAHGYAQTLMMYDIAALQFMYGANYATHGGATVYRWDPLTGEMSISEAGGGFVGQGRPGGSSAPAEANRVFLTVWDGGGADAYDLSNYATAVSIDLRPGQWSVTAQDQLANLDSFSVAGNHARGNVFNALLHDGDTRSIIENATGGSGDDTLTGNDIGNTLSGGAGTDTVHGGVGDDVLLGGGAGSGVFNWLFGDGGTDTASYSGTAAAVYGDLNTHGGLVAGVLTDYYTAIENLTGGDGDNSLVGDGLANALRGGAGDDLLFGGAGEDTLIGGSHVAASFNQLWGGGGADTADYSAETGRIFVDLRAPAGHIDNGSGYVLNDLMNSVENAIGGSNNDILVGTDADANTLSGGGGYDLLFGFAGDDVLGGGVGGTGTYNQLWGDTGSDTASYAFATTRVYADLGVVAGWVDDGSGTLVLNDVYNAIENLIGGTGADSLVGDGVANTLTGGGGADLLYGRGGADRFVYRAAAESNLTAGYDSIADFETGSDKLDFTAFAITSAQVSILAAGGFVSAVYANTDGVAGFELALVVVGTSASVQMADFLF